MGTATTMLVISGSGHVKGGWIAPLLSITLETLHHRTALLPLLKMEGQTLQLGFDTPTPTCATASSPDISDWFAVVGNRRPQPLRSDDDFVGTGGASKSVESEHGNEIFDIAIRISRSREFTPLATSAKNAPKQGSARQTAIAKMRWSRLMSELNVSSALAADLGEGSRRLYAERGRYYHNLKHIAKTLALLDLFCGGSASALLRLAAFYHDAIYDVKATDNEEKERCHGGRKIWLPLGCPVDLADDVADSHLRHQRTSSFAWTPGERLASVPRCRPGDSRVGAQRIRALRGRHRLEYDWMDPETYRRGVLTCSRNSSISKHLFYTPSVRAELQKESAYEHGARVWPLEGVTAGLLTCRKAGMASKSRLPVAPTIAGTRKNP